AFLPRRARVAGAAVHASRYLLRRDRVLALLVGLHRHAQRRAPRPFKPHGDGAACRSRVSWRARGRSPLLRRQAVLRLWSRQRHVVSHVCRRQRRAVARTADARGGLPYAQAISAHNVLWSSDALRRYAGLPAGHARNELATAAPVCLG